jgi:predicted RNA-binding Zn-ribbon protein involved in translation (DUF1610 family)
MPNRQEPPPSDSKSTAPMVCPRCGATMENGEGRTYDWKCPKCGEVMNTNDDQTATGTPANTDTKNLVAGESMTCPFCDAVNEENQENCYRCGEPLNIDEGMSDEEMKAKPEQQDPVEPGGPMPEYDHPLCQMCGGLIGQNEETETYQCFDCGFHTVSEDDLVEGSTMDIDDLQDAAFFITHATNVDEEGIKSLANYLVWGQFDEAEEPVEDLANNPPRWLSEQSRELWETVVNHFGCETKNSAIRHMLGVVCDY